MMIPCCDTHPTIPAMSIRPGCDAVYEPGRTLDDQDVGAAPVVLEAGCADVCLCLVCWLAAMRDGRRAA